MRHNLKQINCSDNITAHIGIYVTLDKAETWWK